MTSAWSITLSAHPPRAAFVNYPLGHTAGRPGEPDEQLAIMRGALAGFHSITDSGSILDLGFEWPGDWRTKARELKDSRSERHDTPQYQSAADRDAAVDRHGDRVACEVCVAAEVPVG